MYKLESVQENGTHKIHKGFGDKDQVIINKKRMCRLVNFPVPTDHRVKIFKKGKRETNTWTLPEN